MRNRLLIIWLGGLVALGCGIEPNPTPGLGGGAGMGGVDGGDTGGTTGDAGVGAGNADVNQPGPIDGTADGGDWTGGDAGEDVGTDDTGTVGDWTGDDTTDGGDWDGGDDDGAGDDGDDGATAGPGGDGTGSTDGTDGEEPGPLEVPNCTGKQCGPDGAGGTCGWCGGNDSCQDGACVAVEGCVPECAGQMIGVDDGCGGVCSGSGFGIGLVPGGAQDASYFTSQVNKGNVPESDKLPIEGWLTQHGTALPPPKTDRLVTLHAFAGLFYDPAEGAPTVAIQLGMNSGLSPEQIEQGKFNLSVVVDRSGSMNGEDKIDFVKQGLVQMLDILGEDDLLSIVTYSTTANLLLEPTAVTEENKAGIIAAIEGITAGGKTNIYDGLQEGYVQVLTNAAVPDMTSRVVLLSDGVATAGITDTDSILAMSASYNQDAEIGLTTIGVGEDLQFDLMHLLATQGMGNFFFLDSAEKLAEVFTEELEYLLTPVADNLQVYFTLPDEFGVEDIYGFEFKEDDGQFHLLGPSPQYTVAGGEVIEDPDPPTGEEPDVAVSTLFASKKNGLLMAKISTPDGSLLANYENTALSTIYYSYELVDTNEIEAFDETVELGSLEYDTTNEGAFSYFSGATMQRNFCILRAGLAMKAAVDVFHASNDIQGAIKTIAQARTFCTGINVQLEDPEIDVDIALMTQLMDNICGEECADPEAQ